MSERGYLLISKARATYGRRGTHSVPTVHHITGDSVDIVPWEKVGFAMSNERYVAMPQDAVIYTVATIVEDVQTDKFGRPYKLAFSEEYVDDDGVFCSGQPLLIYNEDLWDKLAVGSKVRRKPMPQ